MDWFTAFLLSFTGLFITLLTIVVKRLFKHLKKPNNRQLNLFGKQTNIINNKDQETPAEHIWKGVDLTNERLNKGDKKFDSIEKKLDHLILAFGLYVEGNGVSPETKKAVKKILEEGEKNVK